MELPFTEAQAAQFGLYFGVGGLVIFCAFIVWNLARQTKVGTLGTWVMLGALLLGVFGFVVKEILVYFLAVR